MKKLPFKIFMLFLILITAACYDYEPQFEGAYSDAEESESGLILDKEVVYVAGGKVYLADKFVRDSIIIDDSGTVVTASINNNHTKVLFKRDGENIQVYDVDSKSITEEIVETEEAIWFEYHANNTTVYYLLNSGILDTSGPDVLTTRPIDLSDHSSYVGLPTSVVVLKGGDIIYTLLDTNAPNFQYLVLSNGNDVIFTSIHQSLLLNMRTNQEEEILWCEKENSNAIYAFDSQSLTFRESYEGFIIGTPIGRNTGFKITDDNKILTLDNRYVNSPGGIFTSIDY